MFMRFGTLVRVQPPVGAPPLCSVVRCSCLARLRSSFGLRPSDFGFRFLLAPQGHDFDNPSMPGHVSLHRIDLAVFVLYMVATVALGFWVARKGKNTAQGYFL